MRVKAVYPGSFDPVTFGHIDLIRRGAAMFSEVVVGVADNPRKAHLFTMEERVAFLRQATAGMANVSVMGFTSLLVEFARSVDARVIIKGLRAVSDFEYEMQMSLINRRLAAGVETVFMMPSEEYLFVSSSVVKEVASLRGDVSSMAPDFIGSALRERLLSGGGE